MVGKQPYQTSTALETPRKLIPTQGSAKLWLCVPILCVAAHIVFEGPDILQSGEVAAGFSASLYGGRPSLRHCLVLTTDPLQRSVEIAPGLTCRPFLGELFNARQFDLVSEEGKAKLRNKWLQSQASDFSNNKSVSIFVNHARMWKIMDEMPEDEPMLILEDDATIPANLSRTIDIMLDRILANRVTNFVVKLHEHPKPSLAFAEWESPFRIGQHTVRKCSCRPSFTTSGTAAYLLDRKAMRACWFLSVPR